MIGRAAVFAYGVLSYAIFFVTFLVMIAFVGNAFLPRTIDGEATVSFPLAAAINAGLILIFGLQHSVMARPWFKEKIVCWIPKAAERSTYVLASSIALIALMWFWQPMGGTVWDVQDPLARTALYGTADEVHYGVLDRDLTSRGFAYFYFRDPSATAAMVEVSPGQLREPAGSHGAVALAELKTAIVAAGLQPFIYRAQWDEQFRRLIGLKEFGDRVYADLKQSIDQEFGLTTGEKPDEFTGERGDGGVHRGTGPTLRAG